jgi:hypothetical protein
VYLNTEIVALTKLVSLEEMPPSFAYARAFSIHLRQSRYGLGV